MKWKIMISWLLVFLWMGAIFWLSDMDTTSSNNKSTGTINKVIEGTVDTTNKLGITDKHPSDQKVESISTELNKPLRKGMHASVYLVLAILVANALVVSKAKVKMTFILSLIICFLYACSDEFHQLYVNGRTGQFSDVLIDTTGAMIGVGIYFLLYIMIRKIKSHQKYVEV